MRSVKFNNVLKIALLGSASLVVTPAFAQQSTSAGVVDEVIVTAQRREERQIDVPISMTAVSGDTLARAGVVDVQSLAKLVPSFTYEDNLISSGSRARIRGLGSPTFTSGVETSVSVVIDGVVTGPTGSGLSDLFDVERVEVLRGPQGTLFGKNATAGVVSITSKAPTRDFEAEAIVKLTKGDFGPVDDFYTTYFNGFVSGPITSTLSGRIALFTRVDDKGYTLDKFQKDTQNRRNHWGTRLSLRNESGPLTVDFSASYIETADRCCAATFREILPQFRTIGNVPVLIANAALNGLDINPKNRVSIASGRIGEESQTSHFALTGLYDMGDFKLKSITGYRDWKSYGEDDSDRTSIDIADATYALIKLRVFTQELQLISPSSDKLNYVIGAYYYRQKLADTFGIGGGFFTANPLNRFSVAHSNVDVVDYAIYGNFTYNITEPVQLIGGLRIMNEKQDLEGFRVGNFYPANRPFRSLGTEDTTWTGKIGLRYSPVSDANYFLTVSRGYKGFGLNNANNGSFFDANNNANPVLRPETAVNVELGAKNRWLDGRLETNVVVFNETFKDFQTSAFDGASNTFSLRNAGSIRIRGIEFDAAAKPWTGATITAGAAYIDAIFKEFKGAPCTAEQTALLQCPAAGQDLSGRGVDGNPKYQLSLTGRQTFPLGGMEGYVQAEYSYKSKIQYNSDLDPLLVQKGYSLLNLHLGLILNENFEAEVFVDNVANTTYAQRISPAALFPGVSSQYLAPGRVLGVQFKARM